MKYKKKEKKKQTIFFVILFLHFSIHCKKRAFHILSKHSVVLLKKKNSVIPKVGFRTLVKEVEIVFLVY